MNWLDTYILRMREQVISRSLFCAIEPSSKGSTIPSLILRAEWEYVLKWAVLPFVEYCPHTGAYTSPFTHSPCSVGDSPILWMRKPGHTVSPEVSFHLTPWGPACLWPQCTGKRVWSLLLSLLVPASTTESYFQSLFGGESKILNSKEQSSSLKAGSLSGSLDPAAHCGPLSPPQSSPLPRHR